MARLPRLALAGMAHLVTQRAHGERTLFADDADRVEFLRCLRAALQGGAVRLHAYALLADRLWLLLTPTAAADSSRLLQNLAAVTPPRTTGVMVARARCGTAATAAPWSNPARASATRCCSSSRPRALGPVGGGR